MTGPRGAFGSFSPPDTSTFLTLYLILLLAIPSPLVLTALGQIGGPATLLTFAFFAAFTLSAGLAAPDRLGGGRPLRTAALLFLLCFVTVFAHSSWLPLPSSERSPADATLLRLVGFVGLVCVTARQISTRERLWTLVERFVLIIGALAALAAVQMITGQQYVDRLSLPGLSGELPDNMATRGVLVRPSGTSTHPIEYAAVLSMGLPFALAVLSHRTTRPRLYRAIAAATAVVILMTASRTAIVCGAVAFIAMLPAWSPRTRLVAVAGAVAMIPVFFVAVPGFVGTIRGLFAGGTNDTSVASRVNSYAVAGQFVSHHPWLGRGMGTFVPSYWIFDNQYLGLLVSAGIVGVLATLGLIGTAVWSAGAARRRLRREDDRQLATAARAAVLAGTVSLALFDAFSFAQAAGLFFFVIGLCGAVHRLADRSTPTTPAPTALRGRRHDVGMSSAAVPVSKTTSSMTERTPEAVTDQLSRRTDREAAPAIPGE